MGLSDQERMEKMLWACNKITQLGVELSKCERDYCDKFKLLATKTEEIWPAMLNHESNATHWLLGSSASNRVESTSSIWGCSIALHCEKERNKNDLCMEDLIDSNPVSEFLTIERLLRDNYLDGEKLRLTYEIFAWTEEMVYALRRYDDKLTSNFEKLSSLISSIQGICFDIFSSYKDFARAYLSHEIFVKMYFNKEFKVIALKQFWHHDLNRIMRNHEINFEEVMDWHRVVHKSDLSVGDLVLIALKIMGRRYNYDHKYKDLEAYLNGLGISKKFMSRVNNQFKSNKKDKSVKEKEDHEEYLKRHSSNHMLTIHGYDYDIPEKEILSLRAKRVKEAEEKAKEI